MKVTIKDFVPEHTFDCGQCFRGEKQPDGSYIGVAGGQAVRIKAEGDTVTIDGCSEKDYESFWRKYLDATSDAFGTIVLGNEGYYLKHVFWNNYDFDIMKNRYHSLVYMYLKDKQVLGVNKRGEWNDVVHEYDMLPSKIKNEVDSNMYDSYQELINAIENDKNCFKEFMNVHSALAEKMGVDDNGYLMHFKKQAIKNFFNYNRVKAIRF